MEFAILLPLLTLIIISIMMFGIIFHDYLEITHAAREGVRWAALRASLDDVEDKAQAAAPGIDWSQATLTRIGVSDPVTDGDQGNPVTVQITYDLGNINRSFGAFAGLMPSTITSSATQKVE